MLSQGFAHLIMSGIGWLGKGARVCEHRKQLKIFTGAEAQLAWNHTQPFSKIVAELWSVLDICSDLGHFVVQIVALKAPTKIKIGAYRPESAVQN